MRDECPYCGAELPRGALSCPECGSDEQTGWSEKAQSDGLDLPDDSFDYEEFVKREFQPGGQMRKVHWVWWLVALVLIAILAAFWFF